MSQLVKVPFQKIKIKNKKSKSKQTSRQGQGLVLSNGAMPLGLCLLEGCFGLKSGSSG